MEPIVQVAKLPQSLPDRPWHMVVTGQYFTPFSESDPQKGRELLFLGSQFQKSLNSLQFFLNNPKVIMIPLTKHHYGRAKGEQMIR